MRKLWDLINNNKKAFTLAEGATHVDMPPTKAKLAFTLAEVLITLGIIGVVAAMTIPTLMTNIRHRDISVKLQKFSSVMRQMLLTAEDEQGPVNEWNISLSHDEFFETYFLPYVKAGISNNELIFNDGSTMTLYRGACMDLIYDVNGKSKPNKEGYDQFRFLMCPKGDSTWCGEQGFCSYRRNAIRTNRPKLIECCKKHCSGHAGLTCSALLEYDNWHFNKDYPYFK